MKRFRFGYVCGDTGLIDEKSDPQWFIENCCNINDLKKNWNIVCDKLNALADENEYLKYELYNQKKINIIKTYIDNPILRDEKLENLDKEWEERFDENTNYKRFSDEDIKKISTIVNRTIKSFSTVGKKTTISEDLLLQKINGLIINSLYSFLNDDKYYEEFE